MQSQARSCAAKLGTLLVGTSATAAAALVGGVAGPAGEGDDLADVVQARGKQDEALEAQAKTWCNQGGQWEGQQPVAMQGRKGRLTTSWADEDGSAGTFLSRGKEGRAEGDVVTIRHRPPHGLRSGCLNEKRLLCEG